MGLRIMVFDDDKSICNLLKDVLSEKGHDVVTYSDPTEFPLFHEHKCPCSQDSPCADILIADIVMPNMEGIEFFKRLKEAGCWPIKNKNVAIISGFLTIHYQNELNELDVHYVRKPFRIAEICDWVDECGKRIEGSQG